MNSSICLSFQFIAGRIVLVRPVLLFLLCRDSGKLSQDRALVFIEGELESVGNRCETEFVDRIKGGEGLYRR